MPIKYSEKSIYRFQMYCFPRIHWSITTVPEQYELTDVQSHLPVSHIHHPDIELRIRHWEINLGICSHIKIQPPPQGLFKLYLGFNSLQVTVLKEQGANMRD